MQMGIQLQMQNQMWIPIQTQIQARTHMRSNPDPNVEPNPNTANPDPNPDLSPDLAPMVPGARWCPGTSPCPAAPGARYRQHPGCPPRATQQLPSDTPCRVPLPLNVKSPVRHARLPAYPLRHVPSPIAPG